MNENLQYLFQYLEKEELIIDQTEFLFQMQSHPDYPSLLAIADTLSFFSIDNGVLKVAFSEIDLLPNQFIALLNSENEKPQLFYIEKRGENWYINKEKKAVLISIENIEKRWGNIVLLVEKSNEIAETSKSKNTSWLYLAVTLSLFAVLLSFINENWHVKIFFIFPFIGILFSVGALKDLFGTKSEILNKFCNITTSTNCNTVVSSNKWKVFNYISFSDLSIVFFSFQLLGLFWFMTIGNSENFLSVQKMMLLFSIPVLLSSLYYQKFIEKKWCPICLAIIGIIVFETFFLILFQENQFNFSLVSILLFVLILVIVYTVWMALKSILLKQKELKEFQLKGNRFIRNYSIFKNNLLSNPKKTLIQSPIILGNKDSDTEITLITSPFCGYCKEAHEIIEKILQKNRNNLKINLIIKADIDNESELNKTFFRNLMQLYYDKGEIVFEEAMSSWFKNKNINEFNKKYSSDFNKKIIDVVYDEQNNWCSANNYNYTPAIFLNGYEYPSSYERENLEFFINELIEDNF